MRTPLYMVRFATCCFLLSVATINSKAQQQATAPSGSTGSSYFYSSRGIGFKQGNGGFDVFQVQGGEQIGVLKVGGGHIEFKKLGDVSPELEKTVMDAVQDYQMGRVSPAMTSTPPSKPPEGSALTSANPTPSGGNDKQVVKLPNGHIVTFSQTAKNVTHIVDENPRAGALGTYTFDFKNGSLGSGVAGDVTTGWLTHRMSSGKEVIITFATGQCVITSKTEGVGQYASNFKQAVKEPVADIYGAGANIPGFDREEFIKQLHFKPEDLAGKL